MAKKKEKQQEKQLKVTLVRSSIGLEKSQGDTARALGLREIISITRPDNVRSRRVMEKLGLTHRGATHWHGYDQVWYGTELDLRPQLLVPSFHSRT